MQPLAVSLANYISNVAGRAANPYGAILAGAVVLAAPGGGAVRGLPEALHRLRPRVGRQGMTATPVGRSRARRGGWLRHLPRRGHRLAARRWPCAPSRTPGPPRPGDLARRPRRPGRGVVARPARRRRRRRRRRGHRRRPATPRSRRAALEAGKHVFCEKPLALDDAEARDLVATVERTGRVLVVDHVLRYNPLLRALTPAARRPARPGAALLLRERRQRRGPRPRTTGSGTSRVSGGIFVEHGVHFFDAAAMLLDGEPTSVLAVAARRPRRTGGPGLGHRGARRGHAGHAHPLLHPRPPVRAAADAAGLRYRRGPGRGLDPGARRHRRVDRRRRPARRGGAARPDGRAPPRPRLPARPRGGDPGVRPAGRRARPRPRPGRHARHRRTTCASSSRSAGTTPSPTAYAESVRAAMTDLVARIADGGRPQSGAPRGRCRGRGGHRRHPVRPARPGRGRSPPPLSLPTDPPTRNEAHACSTHPTAPATRHRPRGRPCSPPSRSPPRRCPRPRPAAGPSPRRPPRPPPHGHAHQPRPPRLALGAGDPARPEPATRRTGWRRSPRSASCGPMPRTPTVTEPHAASAAAPTTRTTDTWGQGAFNADDISRAAVVYLRHWQATGSTDQPATRRTRCCAASPTCRPPRGPNAGNVVLWMQPDGTLNPQRRARGAARPVRQRRVLLAGPHDLGARRGLRGLPARRPRRSRASCATGSSSPSTRWTGRSSTGTATTSTSTASRPRPGSSPTAPTPPRRRSSGCRPTSPPAAPAAARTALSRLSEGIAEMRGGDARHWPMGAVRPWALSRSVWHAWGGKAPAALARASRRARRPRPRPRRGERLVHLRPVAAHVGRSRQRPAAHPRRRLADRLRRRLAAPVAARDRRRHRRGPRPRRPRRDRRRRGSSAPTPPASRCTTPPPGGPSTASPAPARSTTTPAPSPRSTACCR